MSADPSAYAVLGLEPGADRAQVDAAYRRLIKQHHPDRQGGDSARAAEIIRAYRLLTAPPVKDALELHDHPEEFRRRGWSMALAGGLLAGIAALLLGASPQLQAWWDDRIPRFPLGHSARAGPVEDPMDEPLDMDAIAEAVREARSIARDSDEMALAAASQRCHEQLRREPSLGLLDRCSAFDDAVVLLQDRDPLRDRGRFGELSVTSRQWSAASAMSNDYLAIDGRLDRIRLQVELMLARDREREDGG